MASTEGHIINISSVNGFWACLGPHIAHTSYSAAKFAVKGFTEALQVDLRLNAPHIKASLVMPGHIGTSIAINANRILGLPQVDELPASVLAAMREQMADRGLPVDNVGDEQIRAMILQNKLDFRDNAPLSSAEGATIILDGVRKGKWRILVGDDAEVLDQKVREHPDEAYDPGFTDLLLAAGEFSELFIQNQSRD